MSPLTTISGIISILSELNLLDKWYIILILGVISGPVLSYFNIDYIIHKFLNEKFGFGKQLIEKRTAFKLMDDIFVGTTWWLAVQYILLAPIFNWTLKGYNWIYPTVLVLGYILKFAFGRAYIYESNFESSSKSWRYQNSYHNDTILNQLRDVWKTFAYPSLHTMILLSGLLLGVLPIEVWILAVLSILWLLIVNHHWFSDIVSGALISYASYLFMIQVL